MAEFVTWLVATWIGVLRVVGGLENSLARTPPMGWMSWGFYMCADKCADNSQKCLNEDLIMSVADEMQRNGYQEAGYEYIVIDDCWSERQRNMWGKLVPNKKRFPRGMKFLADYIHSRGLKFGLYGSPGSTTCMRYPGSKNHLREDAETFATWDVDYVKFDGCYVELGDLNTVYIEFGNYLNKTGRPMVYSCSWPYYVEFVHYDKPDYMKIAKTCNLWRNYHDIFTNWASVVSIIHHYEYRSYEMAQYHRPGQWNDPDMVIVGSGLLSPGESRVQLAVWAMLSAPLMLSCDMRAVQVWERQLLLNPYLLAIDQDPLGQPAVPSEINDGITLWVKRQNPLKGDRMYSYSLAFVNLNNEAVDVQFSTWTYNLDNPDGYTVSNVFEGGLFIRNLTLNSTLDVTVERHDVVLLTLFPL